MVRLAELFSKDARRKARIERFAKMGNNTEVFDDIYRRDLWRGKRHGSRSGHGSVGEWLAFSVGALTAKVNLSGLHVVDVGCGDFSFGSRIAPLAARYTGVDASKTIVEANRIAHSRGG